MIVLIAGSAERILLNCLKETVSRDVLPRLLLHLLISLGFLKTMLYLAIFENNRNDDFFNYSKKYRDTVPLIFSSECNSIQYTVKLDKIF
jgi:hypothetical protein